MFYPYVTCQPLSWVVGLFPAVFVTTELHLVQQTLLKLGFIYLTDLQWEEMTLAVVFT